MGKRTESILPSPKEEYDNPIVAKVAASEARAREKAVAVELAKNLREQVSWCHRKNPVTHYYACAEIVAKYRKIIDDPNLGIKYPGAADAVEE